MDDVSDNLPHPAILPAEPGWWITFVTADAVWEEFQSQLGESVIAWHFSVDCWSRPLIAGEQFSQRQEYILRSPAGHYLTTDCGIFRSPEEAFRALRPAKPG